HASLMRDPGEQAARRRITTAPSTPEHAPAPPNGTEVPGALATEPGQVPPAAETAADPALGTAHAPAPGVVSRPAKPVGSKPSPGVQMKAALSDPSGLSGPTSTKDINTPGF
ncbi:MAG TPA: hypothetical protein VFU02_22840, partial [Polyangiaceae bacterium]|nr:hypothetical protein [Polyangiaceae bacterium]